MKHQLVPGKLNKDLSPNKYPNDNVFELRNFRIIANDSQQALSISNEKGTRFICDIPSIRNVSLNASQGLFQVLLNNSVVQNLSYTLNELFDLPDLSNLKLLKFCEIRDELYVFTYEGSYIQIWKLVNEQLQLIYYNDFNFSDNFPIRKIIGHYENDSIKKIYFTDFNNYFRFINIAATDVVNTPISQIDAFPDVTFTKPKYVETVLGGNFKPGFVQYAYNLYDLNGAESKIAPLSEMFTVAKNFSGGEANEIINKAFKIRIDNINEKFKLINVYRLYYATEESLPEVSLIIEENINDSIFEFIDDNNLSQSSTTLENILLIGSDPFKCKDFEVKDNSMFPVNIAYDKYDVDFDARAYSFDNTSQALIQDNTKPDITVTSLNQTIDEEHDCINPTLKTNVGDTNYDKYQYQFDGTTFGAEGPNVKLEFVTKTFKPDSNAALGYSTPNGQSNVRVDSFKNKSLKRDEVYRYFIRFKNNKGQSSFVKWIADIKTPNQDLFPLTSEVNDEVFFKSIGIKTTLKNAPSNATSWEILREVRNKDDRTIITQGVINTMIFAPANDNASGAPAYSGRLQASAFTRTLHNNSNFKEFGRTFKDQENLKNLELISTVGENYTQFSQICQLHSPEINEDVDLSQGNFINIVGGIENYSTAFYVTSKSDDGSGIGTNDNPVKGPNNEFLMTNAKSNSSILPIQDSIDIIRYTGLRKGGTLSVNNITKIPVLGDPSFSDNDVSANNGSLNSYDNGAGITEYHNTSYINAKYSNNTSKKFKNNTNKNITFNISYYGIPNESLEDRIGNNITKTSIGKFIIADYKRVLTNQYGGNTYEAKQKNRPVVVSDLNDINTSTTEFYNGDTYLGFWNHISKEASSTPDKLDDFTSKEVLFLPIESNINLDLRYDEENFREVELKKIFTKFEDYKEPLDVYNKQKQYEIGISKPLNYQELTKYDNRILASDIKINGEQKDSWLQYRENNYLDINGSYDSITGIYEDRDQLFVFQPEAICQLLINPRVQTQSQDNISIELGRGTKLYDYQYLTTSSGSVNQFGVIKTPYGLIYLDLLNKKISSLQGGEKPLSDINGLHSYLRKNLIQSDLIIDNPLKNTGVQMYYDNELKECYLSLLYSEAKNETITFSHLLNGFHTIYDYSFNHAINIQNNIYLVDSNLNKIYKTKEGLIGHYFGNYLNSKITFIVNPNYINNRFDNILFNTINNEKPSKIRVYNDHQDSNTVSPNIKRKFREWRVDIPREENSRNRIMSQYCYLTLEYLNTGNKFSMQDIIVSYQPRPASFV